MASAEQRKSNGENKVKLADIAKQTGYSLATVSKALNGKADISEAARQAIDKALKDNGYIRRVSLSRKQRTIEVVFRDFETIWALEVLRGFPARRIIITPGMVELGEREADYTREFGREMAACVDIAIIVGKNRALPIIEGLKEAGFPEGNIHRVDSLDDSTRLLHSLVRPTDTVLYENDLPDHYQEA